MKDWILDHEFASFVGFTGLFMLIMLLFAAIIHSPGLAIAAWVIGATLIVGSPFWVLLLALIIGICMDMFSLEDRQLPPHDFSFNCPCIGCRAIKRSKPYVVYCRRGRPDGGFYGEL